jgi:hypothetical protein
MSDTIRGGGHVGPSLWFGYHATWPIASLMITPNSIIFSMWPIKYVFEKSSIVCLQRTDIMGWSALSIVHTNPQFSKSVVFRPIKFSATESVLARYGYQVTAEEPSASATASIQYSRTMSIIAYIAAIAGVIAAIVAGFVATKLAG